MAMHLSEDDTLHHPRRTWLPWALTGALWASAAVIWLLTPAGPAEAEVPTSPEVSPYGPEKVRAALSANAALTWLKGRTPAASPDKGLPDETAGPEAEDEAPALPAEGEAQATEAAPQGGAEVTPPRAGPTTRSAAATSPTHGELARPKVNRPAPEPAAARPEDKAPPSPSEVLSTAAAHLNAGRWAEAEAAFGEALSAPGGRTAAAYFGRAKARHGQSRTDEAMTDLEAALKLDPRHPYALLLAGDIARQSGDTAQAQAYFRRYLDAWPRGRRAPEIESYLRGG